MNTKLLGFFSGFPTRHFTDDIADILMEKLDVRDSLVFVSAQPNDYILDTMPDLLMVVLELTRRMPSWLFSKTPEHILTSQLTEKLETRLKSPLRFPRLGLADA